MNTMIIDNDTSFTTSFQKFFENSDTIKNTEIVDDSKIALIKIKKNPPDILFINQLMPNLDGISILQEIKNINVKKDMKVFFMLSFVNDNILKLLQSYKVFYCLIKPFKFDSIIQILHSNKNPTYINENTISQFLNNLSIPTHMKGFIYLKEAIEKCLNNENLTSSLTTILYPEIANKFNSTPSRVERTIRHAIQSAWTDENKNNIKSKLNYKRDKKPTNGSFISLSVYCLKKTK